MTIEQKTTTEHTETQDSASPTTEQILEEVERRTAAHREERRKPNPAAQRVVVAVDRAIFWFTKHWLILANAFFIIYVGLPILAPLLMVLGATGAAGVIHTAYDPLCHQLAQRSFFLFGPRLAYPLPQLVEELGPAVFDINWSGHFYGNPALGYKMALCQRDIGIYGAMALFGLLYGLIRMRWTVKALPFWGYVLSCVPMALDGGYQWISGAADILFANSPLPVYESTPVMRLITGMAFGIGTIWLAYPLVEEIAQDYRKILRKRFGW